jgi:hypothetical protein
MPARDEFTKETKDIVAKRVGLRCSNPNCRRPTSGPQAHPVAGRHVDSRTSGTTSSGGWTRRAARLRRFAMRVPGATAVEAVTAAPFWSWRELYLVLLNTRLPPILSSRKA